MQPVSFGITSHNRTCNAKHFISS